MKLVNETDWKTSDLRKVCQYVVNQWAPCLDDWQKLHITFRFLPSRRYNECAYKYVKTNGEWEKEKRENRTARMYGYAVYNGAYVRVFIPRPENAKDGKIDVAVLGWILMHEMTHIIGQHHKDIKGSVWQVWPGCGTDKNKNHSVLRPFRQFKVCINRRFK